MTTTTTNPEVQIGDLFHDSWGYDQTQVDFYEVVGFTASGKSIRVQPVAQEIVTGEGTPTTRVAAVKGSNYGDIITKRLARFESQGETRFAFRVNSFSSAYRSDWGTTHHATGWGWGR
jgi:hypothetical protein